eukprot:NODE_715_length_1233_cov_257.984797_g572_i0.p1 GENE.NODE_715_length_1233_cov_257.984797_g572_i0~~NODE_715_length_1233_cov_257.984797_g572_i0.p1  ORF type:complete len:230 (-),score=60.01 NODE_715_length_1233_cov_257.984797_g572_i0:88-777(-)
MPHTTGGIKDSANELARLWLQVDRLRKRSEVFKVMDDAIFPDVQLAKVESLDDLEKALQTPDFVQSYVVFQAPRKLGTAEDSLQAVPADHGEIINALWHPHSSLNNKKYPTTLLVLAPEADPRQPTAQGEKRRQVPKTPEPHTNRQTLAPAAAERPASAGPTCGKTDRKEQLRRVQEIYERYPGAVFCRSARQALLEFTRPTLLSDGAQEYDREWFDTESEASDDEPQP